MAVYFQVSNTYGDNQPLTLSDARLYSIKRRDPVNWRKWVVMTLRGDAVRLHDKVWHYHQWKKIIRVGPTKSELNEGQGRR